MQWTPQQTEAIQTRGCNLLVAAAAGAGKTSVLVERIITQLEDPAPAMDVDLLVVTSLPMQRPRKCVKRLVGS